eukprot:4351892-Amphidinium_carterae.2
MQHCNSVDGSNLNGTPKLGMRGRRLIKLAIEYRYKVMRCIRRWHPLEHFQLSLTQCAAFELVPVPTIQGVR